MANSYSKGDEPVPGYRLIGPLGRGGFGEVWKANGPGGIPVAIKIISLSARHGFKELRAIQRVKLIRHPNLIPIIAFWLKDQAGNILDEALAVNAEYIDPTRSTLPRGELTDTKQPRQDQPAELIIAMTLGDRSLFERMEECLKLGLPGVPAEELIGYMEEASKAIDFLNAARHDLGQGLVAIQHCDIKPQNMMIVGGSAAICDFGLARVLGEIRVSETPASFAYAAPEYLQQNTSSSSTDQYSLAISYYELRTSHLPFDSETFMGVMTAKVEGKLSLSKLSEPEQVVMRRATALAPADRYPTTVEMVRELRKAIDEERERHKPKPKRTTDLVQADSEIVRGYRLIRLIGRGGFGEVWEATAPGGRHVALKIIRNLGGARGKREWKALELIKSADHAHLLELHASWLLDSDGYEIKDEDREKPDAPAADMLVIATRLATKNLWQRLQECRAENLQGIPLEELLVYTQQTAQAIDYLNAERHKLDDRLVSIQHRDIKPENLLLVGEGTLNVGDFGLAKVLEGTMAEVHAGSRGLTVYYASPEAFEGRISRWSDQYSLAITYFHLRTGALPFEATSPTGIMEAHRTGKLDLARLPESEQAVIARATAVEPENRYETCCDMAFALEQACSAPSPELETSATPGFAGKRTRSGRIPKGRSSDAPPSTSGDSGDLAVPAITPGDVTLDNVGPSSSPYPHTLAYPPGTIRGDLSTSDTDRQLTPAPQPAPYKPRSLSSLFLASTTERAIAGTAAAVLAMGIVAAVMWPGPEKSAVVDKTGNGSIDVEVPTEFTDALKVADFNKALELIASQGDDSLKQDMSDALSRAWAIAIADRVGRGEFKDLARQIKQVMVLDKSSGAKLLTALKSRANQANRERAYDVASAISRDVLDQFPAEEAFKPIWTRAQDGLIGGVDSQLADLSDELEVDPETAVKKLEIILQGLKKANDQKRHKRAALLQLRALAQVAQPVWDKIHEGLELEFINRSELQELKLSTEDLATIPVLRALDLARQPATATEPEIRKALTELQKWEAQSLVPALDASQWESKQLDALLSRAVELARAANTDVALELSDDVLKVRSDDKAALLVAGDKAREIPDWEKAAAAYRKLLDLGDHSESVLLGYSAVALDKPNGELLEDALKPFWDRPATIESNEKLVTRLAELHSAWIQQRLPNLSERKDFQEILKKTANVPVKAQGGWLLACKAETLLEGKKPAEALEALKEIAAEQAVAYVAYIRAVALSNDPKSISPAVEALNKAAADPTFTAARFGAARHAQAMDIYEKAVATLRSTSVVRPFRLDQAKQASEWLESASRLGELPLPARVNMALAAWCKSDDPKERDADTALRITNELIDKEVKNLGADLVPVLIVNAAAQPDSPNHNLNSLRTFERVLAAPSTDSRPIPAKEQYQSIVIPALERAAKLSSDKKPDETVMKLVAGVNIQKAKLILENLTEDWGLDNPLSEGLNSLSVAKLSDPTNVGSVNDLAFDFFDRRLKGITINSREEAKQALELIESAKDWADTAMISERLASYWNAKGGLLSRFGEIVYGTESVEMARQAFEKAIEADGKNPKYYTDLANLFAVKFDPPQLDEVDRLATHVIEKLDGSYRFALGLKGWVLHEKARGPVAREEVRRLEDEAIRVLTNAIRTLPDGNVPPEESYLFAYRSSSRTYLSQFMDGTNASKKYFPDPKSTLSDAQLRISTEAKKDAESAIQNRLTATSDRLRALGNSLEDVAQHSQTFPELYKEAIDAFLASGKGFSSDSNYNVGVGRAYYKWSQKVTGKQREPLWAEAEMALTQIEPGHPEASYFLAKIYQDRGEVEKAIEVCKIAVSQGAESAAYWTLCVDMLKDLWLRRYIPPHADAAKRALDQHRAWAEQLQRSDKRGHASFLLLATTLQCLGTSGEAESVLTDGVTRFPNDFRLRLAFGKMLNQRKQFGPANEQFTVAVGLAKSFDEKWQALNGQANSLFDLTQLAKEGTEKTRLLGDLSAAFVKLAELASDGNRAAEYYAGAARADKDAKQISNAIAKADLAIDAASADQKPKFVSYRDELRKLLPGSK